MEKGRLSEVLQARAINGCASTVGAVVVQVGFSPMIICAVGVYLPAVAARSPPQRWLKRNVDSFIPSGTA
jgi:hypothetical protein